MRVTKIIIAVFASILMFVLTVNGYGAVKTMDKVFSILPVVETQSFKIPLKVMDNYFGIPRENIQFQNSFIGNNGDGALYEVIFVYTNNATKPGTNYFNELYIVPSYLSSKKGEDAYRVTNIVIIKELSWMQTVGFIANGTRKDSRGFISTDVALVVPDDQTFAFNVLRTLANDPKAPFGLKCLNSKQFFDEANMKFLSSSDMKNYKVHYLSEQFKR